MNKGLEGTLRVKVLDRRMYGLTLGGNIALNRNKLTKFKRDGEDLTDGTYEGYPLRLPHLYRYRNDPRDGGYTYELPRCKIYWRSI